jgi:hypothetical protein
LVTLQPTIVKKPPAISRLLKQPATGIVSAKPSTTPVVRHIPYRKSNYRAPEPLIQQRASFIAGFLSAFKRMAHAIRQALPGHTAPIEGLSLR